MVMNDAKAPPASKVAAASALLDRGWGKAPIQIDLNVKQRFDDFLRELGQEATYDAEHAALIGAVIDSELVGDAESVGIDDSGAEMNAEAELV